MALAGYCCSICGRRFSPQQWRYVCPEDGGNLDVVIRDFDTVARSVFKSPGPLKSMWQFAGLLPLDARRAAHTSLSSIGGTPLKTSGIWATRVGIRELWIKDERANPSGSLKDRATAIVLAHAQAKGHRSIVTASTGNAGVSLAVLGRAVGCQAIVVLPATAPELAVVRSLAAGAVVVRVNAPYEAVFEAVFVAAQRRAIYCRNTGINPFTVEGKKTLVYEMYCQSVGEGGGGTVWPAPDWLVVPVGDGNLLAAVYRGLSDLARIGLLHKMPRLLGVQVAGSAAIAMAWLSGRWSVAPIAATTSVGSLRVGRPADGYRALRAVEATNGRFVCVSETDAESSTAELESILGGSVDVASGAVYAGLRYSVSEGEVGPEDIAALVVSGAGLCSAQASDVNCIAGCEVPEPVDLCVFSEEIDRVASLPHLQ